jgi:hypothetical protein
MKNKIIYLFLLIFSVSLLSSAKKVRGTCGRASACSQLMQKCNKANKTGDAEEMKLPSLGIFLNI